MNGISVIVCCYNSADRLPLALKYLFHQKTDTSLHWEMIIVDNNSTDKTTETATQLWKLNAPEKKLRIIKESRAGLSYARKAGVQASTFDIVIFCDDDNLLSENYLQNAYNLVRKTAPEGYGVWGGNPIEYFDEGTEVPTWFEKEKLNYVVGKQGVFSGDISSRGFVWGAGMIILKKIFLHVFNDTLPMLLLDRTGNVLTSGGDSEISLRALITGYKLYYDENLILKHYISKNKLTPEYNNDLKRGFAIAHDKLKKYNIFIHYVCDKNSLIRIYYKYIFLAKYILHQLNIRQLTDFDVTVLYALLNNRQFYDADFNLMHKLLKLKDRIKLS